MNSMSPHDSEKNQKFTVAIPDIPLNKLIRQDQVEQLIKRLGNNWQDRIIKNFTENPSFKKRMIDVEVLSPRPKSFGGRNVTHVATEQELATAQFKSINSLNKEFLDTIKAIHTEKSLLKASKQLPANSKKIDDKEHNR